MRETLKEALKVLGPSLGLLALVATAGAFANRLTTAEATLEQQAAQFIERRAVDERQNERLKTEEVHREYVERMLIRLEAKVDTLLLAPPVPVKRRP